MVSYCAFLEISGNLKLLIESEFDVGNVNVDGSNLVCFWNGSKKVSFRLNLLVGFLGDFNFSLANVVEALAFDFNFLAILLEYFSDARELVEAAFFQFIKHFHALRSNSRVFHFLGVHVLEGSVVLVDLRLFGVFYVAEVDFG